MRFFLLLINYFDIVMTKSIVNDRTGVLKADVKLFLYDDKLSNCPLSHLDLSHKLQFHVSLRLLAMNISQ